jgi:signal recognition particle GTPase
LSDPEYRKGIIERSLPKIGADISKEFYGGGNLSEKQMADLKEILLNAHYGQDTAEKVRKRVEENGALVQTSDFSDIIHEVLF